MSHRFLLPALLLALGASAAQAATANPVDEIRRNDAALQSLLRSSGRYSAAQQDSLKHLINGMFSFRELGKRALGSNWDTLSKPKQDSFVAVFQRMVETSSLKRLENYRADSTVYGPVTGTGARTQVTAMVYNHGKGSAVTYKLFQENGVWKAWDLVLGQASTLQAYRKQFDLILRKSGYNGLMTQLRKNAGG